MAHRAANVSLGAMVGFVTLFGIALRNGLIWQAGA